MQTNHINEAATQNGNAFIMIDSAADGRPSTTHIRLSNGQDLGLVQSVTWSLGLGEAAKCVVETIAAPAEVKALMENTTVKVILRDNPLSVLWTYYTTKLKALFR